MPPEEIPWSAPPSEFSALIQRLHDQHLKNRQTIGPPAGDEEIARAEEALGFALPPLLKALYGAGNGGWAYNFYPLFGAGARPSEPEGIVDRYLAMRRATLDALESGSRSSLP